MAKNKERVSTTMQRLSRSTTETGLKIRKMDLVLYKLKMDPLTQESSLMTKSKEKEN